MVDDSTKAIYGPTTSRYYFEENVFFSDFKSQTLDTAIHDFHQYNFIQRLNYEYHDLGNIATAISPIFYKLPEQIGVSSGWNSFTPYWDTERVRYYDTQSPFSNMHLVLGGEGRSITDVDYTRNIRPNWNFGFNYRGLFMDKQILRQARGDRNVVSHYYDFFTTYHARDSSYFAFFNFRRMSHIQLENGGVAVEDDYVLEDFFEEFAGTNLVGPQSYDLRTNLHLFHQYRLGKGLEIYHVADKYRQYVEFKDNLRGNDYYDFEFLPNSAVLDRTVFRTFRNELGLKSKRGPLFLNVYWAARNFNIDYKWIDENDIDLETKGIEYYAGARAAFDISSKIRLSAEAEYLLSTNYKAKAAIASPWLDASISRYTYKPGFVQQLYVGTHDGWINDFNNTEATQIQTLAHLRKKSFTLSVGGTVSSIDNYVFFRSDRQRSNQKVLPEQLSVNQFVSSPELRLGFLFWKKLSLSSRGVYSIVSNEATSAIQVPKVFLHGQLAFQDIWVHGNFDFQIGLEAHWQSGYFANGYDVPTQQFYRQDHFMTNEFPLVDVFFNWKMKRGRIFFKYNNVVQAITKTGYIPTPFYPGQINILDFGFDWMFFD
ncbi:hypothetical protein SanaruYs_15780 [Chryseotalea sanaruensis]|uniref:Porin n=1 Tax=Chryseotalea sanaruensis TaxID=2482724 RepID=A0A401U8X3_9BACT|nr:hypothetical protein SanaruYs_15780 [Chryseotalea sanaruensis]